MYCLQLSNLGDYENPKMNVEIYLTRPFCDVRILHLSCCDTWFSGLHDLKINLICNLLAHDSFLFDTRLCFIPQSRSYVKYTKPCTIPSPFTSGAYISFPRVSKLCLITPRDKPSFNYNSSVFPKIRPRSL